MADTRTILTTAYNQTTWQNKVGGTTFYLRKLQSVPTERFRIWNSGDPTFYTIDLAQAIAYYNANILKKPTPTTAPKSKTTPNQNNLKGAADGDNSTNAAAKNAAVTGKPTAATKTTNTASNADEPPGRRQKNPLAYMASFNYQLSLYMITPDAYDAFVKSGYKDINAFNNATSGVEGAGGAFLIAQSGGINNNSDIRAPWFNTDLGIDNLKFTHAYSGTPSTGASVSDYGVSFDIFEPYGFSFLSNLKRASDAMKDYASGLNSDVNDIGLKDVPDNPSRQHFIIGIKFFGYDDNGKLLKGDESFDGIPLDVFAGGAGDSTGLFVKYIDIIMSKVKFTLDGKMTKYSCTGAVIASQTAVGSKRGMLLSDFSPTTRTVGETLDLLAKKLTEDSANNSKNSKSPNTYKITYAPGSEEIGLAEMVSPADLDKLKWAGSGAKTTGQVNDKTAISSTPTTESRELKFKKNQPIMDVITSVISQSQYMEAALKVVYTTNVEPDDKGVNTTTSPNPAEISWFTCVPKISNARWDKTKSDWNYDIEYQIKSYRTPVIKSSYVKSGGSVYGPMKRYSYWFSGKNSEVLEYRQEFNNLYYQTVLMDGDVTSTSSQSPGNESSATPTQTGQRQNQPRLGRKNVGMEAQNSYLTSLYSPADTATADITICGDPDFISVGRATTENSIYNRFYGTDTFSVNADGGQVFIEIDFNEATDYNDQNGTLDINSSILFWRSYPPEQNVKGISYRLLNTESMFSGGTFKQKLKCAVVLPTEIDPNAKEVRPDNADTATSNPGPATNNSSSTTTGTGLKTDPATEKNASVMSVITANVATPVAQTTQTIVPAIQPITVNGAPDLATVSGGFNLSNVSQAPSLDTITSGTVRPPAVVADDDSLSTAIPSNSFTGEGRISTPFNISTTLT